MDILKIIHTKKRISGRKQIASDKGMIHPVREWMSGLLFSCIVITIGGALSTYTFLRYTNIVVQEANASQTHVLYNQVLVLKALKLYQSRNEAFTTLKNTESTSVPVVFDVSSSTLNSTLILDEVTDKATTTKIDFNGQGTQLAN